MKRRILWLLVALMLLMGVCAGVRAEDAALKTAISLSSSMFTEPSPVAVTITVNNGGEELPGAVTLYDPAGAVVTSFGDGGSVVLDPGASKTWTGSWTVTQAQLEAGKISYSIRYPYFDAATNDIVYKTELITADISFEASVTQMNVNRQITPTIAREGQVVTVVYTISNTGTVGLSNIRIKENSSISTETQSIETLSAGESKQITFTATMGKQAMTSSATITYKAAGTTKTQTYTETSSTIAYGDATLSAKLEASNPGVAIGDTITLTLTLTSSGNMNYSNITVTDPTLGEVFANQTLEAGKSLTLTKELNMQESASYLFTINATDEGGSTQTLLTDPLPITVVDPNKKLALTLNLTSNQMVMYQQPTDARFTLVVTNTSELDATKVVITHGTETIFTYDIIPAGASRTLVRDFALTMPGTYQMTATTTDLLGNTVVFTSNPLSIGTARATAVPTTVPIPTVPPIVLEDLPTMSDMAPGFSVAKNVLVWVYYVALALLAVAVILLIVALVLRRIKAVQSAKALDHLELAERRDYAAKSDKEPTPETPVAPPAEESAPESAAPAWEASSPKVTAAPAQETSSSEETTVPAQEAAIPEEELPHIKYTRTQPEQVEKAEENAADQPVQQPAEESKATEEIKPEQPPVILPESDESQPEIISGSDGSYRLPRPTPKAKPAANRHRRTVKEDGKTGAEE